MYPVFHKPYVTNPGSTWNTFLQNSSDMSDMSEPCLPLMGVRPLALVGVGVEAAGLLGAGLFAADLVVITIAWSEHWLLVCPHQATSVSTAHAAGGVG